MFQQAQPVQVGWVEAERRRWLMTLAAACEHALEKDDDRNDPTSAALLNDIAGLLARVRAELGEETPLA
jgi:hypothetical protein